MELQRSTRNIGSIETVYDGKLEQAVDSDVTLPEYCPDILRILQCTIEPSIASAQAVGERVTVEGSARVCVLYAGEDGGLQSFEQTYPFTRTADINGLGEGAVVTASAKAEYANGRAVSQRRLDIHGMLSIRLLVRRRKEEAILTAAEGGGMQSLQDTIKLSSLEALSEIIFPLTEVIEVEPSAPAVDQVILRRAVALPGEIKAIKNKLLLKGNLEVRVIYRSRDAKTPVQLLHTMPISQIIEAPGVTEETANTLRLRTLALEVTPKPDSNGAPRLLDIAVRIAAEVGGYQPLELPVLADAYSTQGGVQLDTRRLETRQLLESFQDTTLAKGDFDFGSAGIESVQLLSGEVQPVQAALKGDGLELSGTLHFRVVYLDGEGQVAYAEKELPFSYRKPRRSGAAGETLWADAAVDLISVQESVSGNNLELRAELGIVGDVFRVENREVVSGINPAEEDAPAARSPLTIYFASAREPLWEIARRYRTTTDAIREENEIGGETAEEGQMLLIPGV
ncbi:MAG: DUF3794 domain-containing protein [Oscillospiraceae bacterium]|jgi:hypothetical protein|nr:DUF3794 domain-containing protein [Oscillospiraceae bacterium]